MVPKPIKILFRHCFVSFIDDNSVVKKVGTKTFLLGYYKLNVNSMFNLVVLDAPLANILSPRIDTSASLR